MTARSGYRIDKEQRMRRIRLKKPRGRRLKILLLVLSLGVAALQYLFRTGIPGSRGLDDSRCGGVAACFAGPVTRIVDGDTLDVSGERIRLVLVNAPERATRFGPAATKFLQEMCPVGSAVLVDQDDLQQTDNYGRMLAVVWCGEMRVNEALIRAGHARLYERFCRQSEFGLQLWAVTLGCE
jgi:endonuclease YncB( thermonuclease family)